MIRSLESLGMMIKKYRKESDYSQSELAVKYGVTIAAISSWERGVSRPGIEVALKIASDMHLSLEDFFVDSKKKETLKLTESAILYDGNFQINNIQVLSELNRLAIQIGIQSDLITKSWIEEVFTFTIEEKYLLKAPVRTQITETNPYYQKNHLDTKKGFIIDLEFDIKKTSDITFEITVFHQEYRYIIPHVFLHIFSEEVISSKPLSLEFNQLKDVLEFLIKNKYDAVLKNKIHYLVEGLVP